MKTTTTANANIANTAFDIKKALILANKKGNRQAINKKIAEEAGVDEIAVENWKIAVENLRSSIAPYIIEKGAEKPDAKKLSRLRGKIFPQWKKIIKKGDDTIITELSADVDSLVGFAETWVATEKGSVWAVDSPTIFRKSVEAYLGCKIAKNAVLGDSDRDAIKAVLGGRRRVSINEDRLKGVNDKNGKHTNGITENLELANNKVAACKVKLKEIAGYVKNAKGDMLTFFRKMEEDIRKDLEFNESEVSRLENEKKQAEENIAEAKKTINENIEAYDAAMEKINEIEG